VVRTSSLVAIHGPEITLAPINTGSVLYAPAPRGSGTLVGIAEYSYEESRRRRGSRKAIAEVAVNYAVPDILNHIVRVERRRHGRPAQVLADHDRPQSGDARNDPAQASVRRSSR
jgi:hypothetical protein